MSKPAWHSTFDRMRLPRQRDWMTLAEFVQQLGILGVSLSRDDIWRAVATNPPVKVGGVKRYRECHLSMAVGYAKARRLVMEARA